MVDIDEFLSPERLLLDFPGDSKQQLFHNLANLASTVTNVDAATILNAIEQRERLGTTGIGEGIAIPHARVPGLPKLIGYFARLGTPVDYDALDDAPVDLVFLLLAPEAESTVQLKALARIARILRDPEVGARLRTEREPQGVWGLLRGRVPGQAA
jgi:nitrogen PTS system EIIA component